MELDDRFEISIKSSISLPTFSKIYQKLWILKFRPVSYLNLLFLEGVKRTVDGVPRYMNINSRFPNLQSAALIVTLPTAIETYENIIFVYLVPMYKMKKSLILELAPDSIEEVL